jgi:hypothetical protein
MISVNPPNGAGMEEVCLIMNGINQLIDKK